MWEKETMLITSIFSIFQNVFKCFHQRADKPLDSMVRSFTTLFLLKHLAVTHPKTYPNCKGMQGLINNNRST